jgi:hypothetical protein
MAGFLPTKVEVSVLTHQQKSIGRITLRSSGELGCGGTQGFPIDVELSTLGSHIGSLAGRVVDQHGGIDGAHVSLLCGQERVCRKTSTNSKGEFRFANVAPETYAVTVEKKGYYYAVERNWTVREDLTLTYGSIFLERCPKGNCDPALRPKPPTTDAVVCM